MAENKEIGSGAIEYSVTHSFVDITPLVYQTRLEKVLKSYGDNDELKRIGKDFFRPLNFYMTTNGLL